MNLSRSIFYFHIILLLLFSSSSLEFFTQFQSVNEEGINSSYLDSLHSLNNKNQNILTSKISAFSESGLFSNDSGEDKAKWKNVFFISGISVLVLILIAILIGFGYYCYRKAITAKDDYLRDKELSMKLKNARDSEEEKVCL